MLFDIAHVGTSLTWAAQWIGPLQNRLQLETGRFVRPYNFGINGGTSNGMLDNIMAVANLRPAFVTIESSMNDSEFLTRAQAIFTVTAIINSLKSVMPGNRIFLMTMNPTISPPADSLRGAVSNYYDDYRSMAASQGVGLIDCYPAWLTYGVDLTKITDGVHPTTAAHLAVTVPTIINTLAPIITA